MKKLVVARSAGFCFGVQRSVEMAERALADGPCYCLGALIHNRAEVSRLCSLGMLIIATPEELPTGERVLIRAHGASRETYERLKERSAVILDATCPRVLALQKLISNADAAGRIPIILGESGHPEVLAACGWCRSALVFSDVEALDEALRKNPELREKPISVLFQTTQTEKIHRLVTDFVKKECTNAEVFDTICGATFERQSEARRIATLCDAVVVIGGKHSANSVHLAELCRESCAAVQFIENAEELDATALGAANTIGVTAGASTPAWIIKEVKQKMSDEIKIQETPEELVAETAVENAAEGIEEPAVPETERSFDEMLEDSIRTIYNGDTVSGIVAAITTTEVSVELGTKQSGYIPVSEFTEDSDQKLEDIIHVGDPIEACVVRVNDVEGTVMLSKKRLDAVRNWSDIETAKEEGTVVEGKVTEDNKGGVVVTIRGIRVFVPASQTGLPRETPMNELLGQTVRLKITEVNRARHRVVGSIRAVASRERRERAEKIWNEIEVGKHYNGVVKSMTSYGAFVDIGGIDGMVHVSELSWERIGKPADILTIGQELDVYVIGFDKENCKISLGHKDPNANPWKLFTDAYEVGSVANVRIVKLMPFGAFAEVMPGVDGLIHISQIANRRIGKPDEVLTVGEQVDAKITGIDNEKQKISLSIRALSEPAPAPRREREQVEEQEPSVPNEDALIYSVSADGEATGNLPSDC